MDTGRNDASQLPNSILKGATKENANPLSLGSVGVSTPQSIVGRRHQRAPSADPETLAADTQLLFITAASTSPSQGPHALSRATQTGSSSISPSSPRLQVARKIQCISGSSQRLDGAHSPQRPPLLPVPASRSSPSSNAPARQAVQSPNRTVGFLPAAAGVQYLVTQALQSAPVAPAVVPTLPIPKAPTPPQTTPREEVFFGQPVAASDRMSYDGELPPAVESAPPM